MMKTKLATWTLKGTGTNTWVGFKFQYTTNPGFIAGLMKNPMRKKLISMLVGLKYYAETGNLVTPRNIKSIMKQFKKLKGSESFNTLMEPVLAVQGA